MYANYNMMLDGVWYHMGKMKNEETDCVLSVY